MTIFTISDKEEAKLKEWQNAIKTVYGEYGDYLYTFDPNNGIGVAISVYSKLANKTIDITDIDSW